MHSYSVKKQEWTHMSSVSLQFVDLFSQVFIAYLLYERQFAGDAGNPLSFILYNKNLCIIHFVPGTFLSTLQKLTHLILLTTLLWCGYWGTEKLNSLFKATQQVGGRDGIWNQAGSLRKCSSKEKKRLVFDGTETVNECRQQFCRKEGMECR